MKIKNLIKNIQKNYIGGQEDIVVKKSKETDNLLISEEDFSVMDLLSEGPIDGLVDRDGKRVDGSRILCGVYFNDVPVRETTEIKLETLNKLYITGNHQAINRTEIIQQLNSYQDKFFRNYTNNINNKLMISAELSLFNESINLELMDLLNGEEGISFNSYMKSSSPITLDLNFVKYLLIDFSYLADNWENLKLDPLKENDIKIMYSGANGIGMLKNRIRKPDEAIFNNSNSVLLSLPDPFLNVNYAYEKTEGTTLSMTTLSEGYLMIPLFKNDEISMDGEGRIYFSAVDSECIDEVSRELLNARIFISTQNNDENYVFNYDKISFELLKGEQNQGGFEFPNRTSRTVQVNFKLNGSIDSSSFSDSISAKFLTDLLDPGEILTRNLVNQKETISNGIFEGNSIYTEKGLQNIFGEDINAGAKARGGGDLVLANDKPDERNYAAWAKGSIGEGTIEKRDIFEHIIENSAVSEVSVVFTVSQLYDTYIREAHQGSQIPAFLEIGIVVGLEGDQNENDPLYDTLRSQRRTYLLAMEGLVSQGFRFRVGDYSNEDFYLVSQENSDGSFTPNRQRLFLPQSIQGKNRYLKVYRITPETFSSKRYINVSISAVNEYYPYNFNYPLSAVSLTKISSRSFSNLPARTFDAKLKKVLIPSNYSPIRSDGSDKRFIQNAATYDGLNQIYFGDWDGTFKFAWTDNPAWIIYDLLVNPIYGIGNSIDSIEDINIWKLYEIGRYSDAVDDNGYFVGVPDGYGGLEPRFSFNIVFNNEQEAYDMINSVAVAFRGSAYYAGSEIDFYYDRPDELIAIFNNRNVKDGSFSYSDTLKSSRYTIVEVPYLDKRDNFLQKIEYYEDEENIAKYGYIKKTFEGIGITSKGQARRFAKYALLSNKYETETVSFVAKEEGMFLSPGDIIRIDDEIKNIDTAEGFILDVDNTNKKLITNYIDTGSFDTGIYVYKSVGETGVKEIFENVYSNLQNVTLSQINSTNVPKINLYKVDSYQYTGSSNGGTGLLINLDSSSDLTDVNNGSFFSIKKTGRNENLYKVVNINDIGNGEFEVSAMESEQRKYDLIDFGNNFIEEEEYFQSIPNDFNNNAPDPPLGITIITGLVNNLFTVSGLIQPNVTDPLADEFEAIFISPFGNSQIKTVENVGNPTSVAFDGIKEYGGNYEIRAYSITKSPYYLKSPNYASTTINVPIEDISIYNKIRIFNVDFGLSAQGSFKSQLFAGGLDSGNFETYLKNFSFNMNLRDRFGLKIDTQEKMEQHWDKPKISIDILDENNDVKKLNHAFKEQNLNFSLTENDLKSYFDNSFPRNFKIQIRVTGNSQTAETTGYCFIQNPPATITEWAVSSSYDGVKDGFYLYMDAPYKYKGDIESFTIYSGTGNFTPSDNNKFIDELPSRGIYDYKRAYLYSSSQYNKIINNTFFSRTSIKDSLFKNGEKILFLKAEGDSLPEPINTSTQYEIILGKTIDSEFYFDADYGYVTGGTSIGSLSYGYQGQVNQDYIELQRLTSMQKDDNTNGGVGLFDSEIGTSDYPIITNDIAYFGKFVGIKNQYSDGFYFSNGGIRMATSGTSTYPMQKEYKDATFSTYISSNDLVSANKSTIFDFGSPTGGCLLFVENITFGNPDFKYTFRAITKNQTDGTGEKIEMTGLVDAIGGAAAFTRGINHVAVSIDTISGESDSIVRAYLYVNGEIANFQEVSGWGINDHNHACAIGATIGNSIGESASNFGNFFNGHMADVVMYNKFLGSQEVQSLFYGSHKEYKFQVSTGNNEILRISGDNAPNRYEIASFNDKIFTINFFEDIVRNGQQIDLRSEIERAIGFNGVRKQFEFINDSSAIDNDLLYGDIVNYSYYLTELDYKSEDYVWRNIVYPQYKVRYLPNKPGSDLSSYDQAGALVLYTPNTNKEVNVTGVYVQEIGGVKYARLFLDEEYLGFRETGLSPTTPISNYDSLILKNLQNLGITSTECRFINYQNFTNVSTNILLTGTNSNTGYENFTGWNKVFQSSETEVVDGAEITLGKNYQIITDDSEEFYEGVWIAPQIPLQVENWYTASIFYKTDTNLDSGNGWNYRVVLGDENVTFGAIAGITIYPSGNILQEWKEPALDWSDYFEYGDTGIITSGDWKRAYFNFKPLDFEDTPYYILKIAQLYLERTGGAATTGSGIFALPQIELATGINGQSPSRQQPTTWNSPEYPIGVDESSENEGFNDYKQLNVYPYNQNILDDDFLVISQNTAIAKKTSEPSGLYTGAYAKAVTGYIGGANGERIEWSGNYKRYDNLYNDFISITGYYPYGRWIIYSGLQLTGDGPIWGGWDIIAHYTGEDSTNAGLINISENFDWSNDTKEIEKRPPVGAKFVVFDTDYSIITNKSASYEISDTVGKDTPLDFSDFNIKILPNDIWNEGIIFPSGNNYPLEVNYVSLGQTSFENKANQTAILASNTFQLLQQTNNLLIEYIGDGSYVNNLTDEDIENIIITDPEDISESEYIPNNKVSVPYFIVTGPITQVFGDNNRTYEIKFDKLNLSIPYDNDNQTITIDFICDTVGAETYYRIGSSNSFIKNNQTSIPVDQGTKEIQTYARLNGYIDSEKILIIITPQFEDPNLIGF